MLGKSKDSICRAAPVSDARHRWRLDGRASSTLIAGPRCAGRGKRSRPHRALRVLPCALDRSACSNDRVDEGRGSASNPLSPLNDKRRLAASLVVVRLSGFGLQSATSCRLLPARLARWRRPSWAPSLAPLGARSVQIHSAPKRKPIRPVAGWVFYRRAEWI
jgi:hypothetical protein